MKQQEFFEVMAELMKSEEFADLSAALKSEAAATWYLWIFAKLESEFNHEAVSPRGALGMWQLMPATIKLFKKAYPSLPTIKGGGTAVENGKYACRHIIENIAQAKKQRPFFKFPEAKAGLGLIQQVRFYYHNGPAPTPNPKYVTEIENDQVRLRTILDGLYARLFS